MEYIKDIMLFLITLIVVCLIFISLTCGFSKKLPPGYKFLCSIEGHRVTLQYPDGSIHPNTWLTKYEVADYARYYEKNKNKPIKNTATNYTWELCD